MSMLSVPREFSALALAVLTALPAYAAAPSSNHTDTTGDQTFTLSGLDVTNDNWTYRTTGNIDMTLLGGSVNTGSLSFPDAFTLTSTYGSLTLHANDLNVATGTTHLNAYGDANAVITESHLNGNPPPFGYGLWVVSDTGDVNVGIKDSTLVGRLNADAAQNATVAVEGSDLDGGILETSQQKTVLGISDSTLIGTNTASQGAPVVHMEGDKGALAVIDNSTIGLADDSAAARNPDVEVISSGGGEAGVVVHQSQIENGISTYAKGSDSTIVVNNSQVGTEDTAGNAPFALVAQSSTGVIGEGNAVVSVDDSTIYGDISAQSMGDAAATVSVTGGSTVNGDISLIGSDMTVTLDDAIFNGDISTQAFRESDVVDGVSNTTVNVSNTTYSGDITASDKEGNLTVNINDGAIIGGDALADPMSVTGYDNVNFNVNYLDPSLIDTGKESFFYFNTDENILVNSSISTGTLSPIRSGAYIIDDVVYDAKNVSDEAGNADKGTTWDVTFHTDSIPDPIPDPTPDPTPDPIPDPTPDPIPDPTPAPTPKPDDNDVAADLQAAQAGLLASDDMIHRIAGGITRQLDTHANADHGNHLWMQGIYAGGDRTAGVTSYNTDISGFEFGGDKAVMLKNNSVLHFGAALGYLHNDMDLNNKDGFNDISGAYYSLYGSWNQLLSDTKQWGWFADIEATYGDMSYSSGGKDGKIRAGGDYDGDSFLVQSRVGAHIRATPHIWVRPYLTLGYDNILTESYNDGYSDVGAGHFSSGFVGAGLKAGTHFRIGQAELKPFVSLAWNGQMGSKVHFSADNYHFAGQNLDGGNAGIGINAEITHNWSASASVNTEFGHDIDKQVSAWLGGSYHF